MHKAKESRSMTATSNNVQQWNDYGSKNWPVSWEQLCTGQYAPVIHEETRHTQIIRNTLVRKRSMF